MFHWICPECGSEIPPSVRDCPSCEAATPAPQSTPLLALAESIKREQPVPPAIDQLALTMASPRPRVNVAEPIPVAVAEVPALRSDSQLGWAASAEVVSPEWSDAADWDPPFAWRTSSEAGLLPAYGGAEPDTLEAPPAMASALHALSFAIEPVEPGQPGPRLVTATEESTQLLPRYPQSSVGLECVLQTPDSKDIPWNVRPKALPEAFRVPAGEFPQTGQAQFPSLGVPLAVYETEATGVPQPQTAEVQEPQLAARVVEPDAVPLANPGLVHILTMPPAPEPAPSAEPAALPMLYSQGPFANALGGFQFDEPDRVPSVEEIPAPEPSLFAPVARQIRLVEMTPPVAPEPSAAVEQLPLPLGAAIDEEQFQAPLRIAFPEQLAMGDEKPQPEEPEPLSLPASALVIVGPAELPAAEIATLAEPVPGGLAIPMQVFADELGEYQHSAEPEPLSVPVAARMPQQQVLVEEQPPEPAPAAAVPPEVTEPQLAGLRGTPQTWRRSMKPAEPRMAGVADTTPRMTLPGPAVPIGLTSLTAAGITIVRSPGSSRAAATAAVAAKPQSQTPWLLTGLVTMVFVIIGIGLVTYLTTGSSEAEPVPAPASAATVKPSSSLATTAAGSPAVDPAAGLPLNKQVEVTGFRMVAIANRQPEIHYLVVNHSAANLSNLNIYVTLRTPDAKPGQPPFSRFSFRAPALGPFEAREMVSPIERIPRQLSLPEWQNLKSEIEIAR